MFQEYYEGFDIIKKQSKSAGVSTQDIALSIIQNNLKSIQDYVRRAGMIPETNLIKLSVQAQLIHENEIAKQMRLKSIPYEKAEKLVLAEENRKQYFTGDSEEFLGLTLSAITEIAKKGIAKINEVRASKGKKPILSGAFWQMLKKKGEDAGLQLQQADGRITLSANLPQKSGGATTELGAGLEASASELESQKKKAWLKKNLVWIILGVVALGVAVWFLAKKK